MWTFGSVADTFPHANWPEAMLNCVNRRSSDATGSGAACNNERIYTHPVQGGNQ